MVFDGDFLPSKAATEESRARKRDQGRKLANELLKAGKRSEAFQEFQKCIDITPEMACHLIHHLKKMGIPYVVAPYEADAQLVYLERRGVIDGIISDDSDLLVFGAKRLLTKLDQYGNCIEINRRDFGACREISLTGWTDAGFRRMAIMSGCDYIRGLPKVGLKTAYRVLRKCKTPERVIRTLQFQGARISENYLTEFYQAELTFLHQWVFCPVKKELVHLTELDGSRTAEEMPYIGARVEPELARAIARGDVDPITKEPVVIPTTPSKKRHPQTAATHPPAKPIISYFKGHSRVSMGEMVPNCFSVDLQRVSQIIDGGPVPRVFPLPRPYLDDTGPEARASAPRRTSSTPVRTSRLQKRRMEPLGDALAHAAGNQAPARSLSDSAKSPAGAPLADPQTHPKKKARLCGEVDEDGSPKNSRFFGAPKPKNPRRAVSDELLLSDDSIEEALRDLPDFGDWKPAGKAAKSISIFSDASQETAGASASQQTQSSKGRPDSSAESSVHPPKSTKPRSRPSQMPARLGLDRFAFSDRPSATPASSASSRSSVFSAASTPSTAPSTARSRLAPLQRLGARATLAPVSPRPPKPKPAAGFAASLPVNPAFVPLPKVDVAEVEALNRPCGSEDQIADPDAPPAKLNLARFAYS